MSCVSHVSDATLFSQNYLSGFLTWNYLFRANLNLIQSMFAYKQKNNKPIGAKLTPEEMTKKDTKDHKEKIEKKTERRISRPRQRSRRRKQISKKTIDDKKGKTKLNNQAKFLRSKKDRGGVWNAVTEQVSASEERILSIRGGGDNIKLKHHVPSVCPCCFGLQQKSAHRLTQ